MDFKEDDKIEWKTISDCINDLEWALKEMNGILIDVQANVGIVSNIDIQGASGNYRQLTTKILVPV